MGNDPILGLRDIAGATCEIHPHDLRRVCSTVVTPFGNAKCDNNQTSLAAAMTRAADVQWRAW